jgi:hypothetical protein
MTKKGLAQEWQLVQGELVAEEGEGGGVAEEGGGCMPCAPAAPMSPAARARPTPRNSGVPCHAPQAASRGPGGGAAARSQSSRGSGTRRRASSSSSPPRAEAGAASRANDTCMQRVDCTQPVARADT